MYSKIYEQVDFYKKSFFISFDSWWTWSGLDIPGGLTGLKRPGATFGIDITNIHIYEYLSLYIYCDLSIYICIRRNIHMYIFKYPVYAHLLPIHTYIVKNIYVYIYIYTCTHLFFSRRVTVPARRWAPAYIYIYNVRKWILIISRKLGDGR